MGGHCQVPVVVHTAHLHLTLPVCSTWCVLVCSSRIYLGMHSLADIVVGLVMAVLLLFIVLPVGQFV